jgi:hypothetical protein
MVQLKTKNGNVKKQNTNLATVPVLSFAISAI